MVTPKISFLFTDPNIDYLCDAGMPIMGGEELKTPLHPSSSPEESLNSIPFPEFSNVFHKQDVSPAKTVSPDAENELEEEEAENVDASTLYSVDTNFESTKCLRNYTINVSRDILEKSAQAYSSLVQIPCFPYKGTPCFPYKGTVRKMAQTMVE